MTKQQLNARITELMRTIAPDIKQECKRLLSTGALDYDREDMRSYVTAKTVLAVAMQNIISSRLNYYSGEDFKNRENLCNF